MDRTALPERLYAEYLSAPLRDQTQFVTATTTIDESILDDYVGLRGKAFRAAALCSDEDLPVALEKARSSWTYDVRSTASKRIVTALSAGAGTLLRHSGTEMILQVTENEPGRELLRWRFVSLALPSDVLLAAATKSGTEPPRAIRLLDASISPDLPVAQHHVHHAATMSFQELWASLRLRALLDPASLFASLRDSRAFCPGLHDGPCFAGRNEADIRRGQKHPGVRAKHMVEWGDLIRQAFIARDLLSRHSHHSGPVGSCADIGCSRAFHGPLRSLRNGNTKDYRKTGALYPWQDVLTKLARRTRGTGTGRILHPSHLGALLLQQLAHEERLFLAGMFAYLNPGSPAPWDPDCELLFLQYLRVKTGVFGLLVHRPGEHGLETFLGHFQQIKVYAPGTDSIRPKPPRERGLRVAATEYRIAPNAWLDTFRHERRQIEDEGGADRVQDSEAAWLIHFKRDRPNGRLPLYSRPIRTMDSEADSIVRACRAEPRQLRRLRGIDICGVEGRQPLWVSADTLRRVRGESRSIAGSKPWLHLEPLRLTLHAGEDFGWLTSGVRAVAEPFQWRLIERGDRIGHALAIAVTPIEWWSRRVGTTVKMPRIDRLLDLAFLAEYVGTNQRSVEETRWLRLETARIAKDLLIEPLRDDAESSDDDFVSPARDIWRHLGLSVTRRIMHTQQRSDSWKSWERWIHRYLWDRSVQDRASATIEITLENPTDPGSREELSLLEKARMSVIRDLAYWQVCIEVNPSSNLIVGSLDAVGVQMFLQRRPTERVSKDGEVLTWTISTDDPISFSTALGDEYAYTWAGMVLREKEPCDPSYARALLDEAAATSMRMRFTLPPDSRRSPNRHRSNGWRW